MYIVTFPLTNTVLTCANAQDVLNFTGYNSEIAAWLKTAEAGQAKYVPGIVVTAH